MGTCCSRSAAANNADWTRCGSSPPTCRRTNAKVPAPARQRVEMLQLAIGGHPSFRVCTREIERDGISYTAETLASLRTERPEDDFFLLLGADALADFVNWREPRRIAELATLVSVPRTGVTPPDFARLAATIGEPACADMLRHQVEMPRVDLSSSDLRTRSAAQRSIRYRTPRAVERFIESGELYRWPGNERAPT